MPAAFVRYHCRLPDMFLTSLSGRGGTECHADVPVPVSPTQCDRSATRGERA